MKENLLRPDLWRIMSEQELFNAYNLDPLIWKIKNWEATKWEWQSLDKDWEVVVTELWRIKINFEKILPDQQLEFIDVIKNVLNKEIRQVKNPEYNWWGLLLNLNIADSHFNRIEHKDPAKYLDSLRGRILRLFEKGLKENPDKTLFVDYWDFFNAEADWKTEKGTLQHSHNNVPEMFRIAAEFKKSIYDTLSSELPLDVIEVGGNHDRKIHKMLAESMKIIYSGTNNVNINVVDNFRAYYRWWDVLTWHSHWDWEKEKDLLGIVNVEQKLWKHNYFTRWHTHVEQSKVYWPLSTDVIPTTANPSAWEINQWYLWKWKLKAKLYDKKAGKIKEFYQ